MEKWVSHYSEAWTMSKGGIMSKGLSRMRMPFLSWSTNNHHRAWFSRMNFFWIILQITLRFTQSYQTVASTIFKAMDAQLPNSTSALCLYLALFAKIYYSLHAKWYAWYEQYIANNITANLILLEFNTFQVGGIWPMACIFFW